MITTDDAKGESVINTVLNLTVFHPDVNSQDGVPTGDNDKILSRSATHLCIDGTGAAMETVNRTSAEGV